MFLALIAQWGREYLPRRRIVIGFLAVLSCVILLIGFFVLTVGFAGSLMGQQFGKPIFGIGIWLLIGAALSGLSLVPGARRIAARVLPEDLESTSRVVGFWVFILTLSLLVGIGANFDLLNRLSALPETELVELLDFSPASLLLGGLSFPLIALFGAGFPFKRSLREVFARLGLGPVKKKHWLWIAGFVLFAFVFDTGFSWVLKNFSVGTEQKIDQILSLMAGAGNKTWSELFILAAAVGISAGIGEELLFRGLLQPVFGNFLSAVLFASLHLQYGFTLVLVQIVIGAMVLGYVKKQTNTSVVILAHGLYDFIAVILTGLG